MKIEKTEVYHNLAARKFKYKLNNSIDGHWAFFSFKLECLVALCRTALGVHKSKFLNTFWFWNF